jgi:hypothetical protein
MYPRGGLAFACILLLLGPTAGAAPATLPVSGLTLDLPDGWSAAASSDDSAPVDVLTRAGSPALSIAVGLSPAGNGCAGSMARLAQKGGLSLFDRPAYLGPRWHAQITDETDFSSGTAVQSVCADGSAGAVLGVVSYTGDVAELGGSTDTVGRMLDAVLDASEAAGPERRAYTASGPVMAAMSSAGARIRILADPASATAAMVKPAADVVLPAGSGVLISIDQKVSSKKNKSGDVIKASVANDVRIDDVVVIAKGAAVTGRVAEADSASLGGSGGSLTMEFSSVNTVDGRAVPLKYTSQKEGARTKALSLKGFMTGYGLLSTGDNVEIEAGTTVEAKTTEAVTIRAGG